MLGASDNGRKINAWSTDKNSNEFHTAVSVTFSVPSSVQSEMQSAVHFSLKKVRWMLPKLQYGIHLNFYRCSKHWFFSHYHLLQASSHFTDLFCYFLIECDILGVICCHITKKKTFFKNLDNQATNECHLFFLKLVSSSWRK